MSKETAEFSFGEDIEVLEAGIAQIDWVKILTYGPSGAGKTTLLSTMPDPLLVLLTEKHGAMTVKRVNPNAKIIFIEDKIGKVSGKKLRAGQVLHEVLEKLATEDHPYQSVALDSLTDMQQILLSDMKGGKPGAKVSLPEWGTLIDKTKHLVKTLRNLNMHVGVICLSDEVQDHRQRMIHRPALAGKKLPGNIIQYFNLCCFERKVRDPDAVGGATYEAVFDAGDEYYTKTHPALDAIEPPTVRGWIDKIAQYAREHDEGDMPTTSSPVSAVAEEKKVADRLKERMENPEIKDLFDRWDAPEGKRLAALRKYKADDKLIEVLTKFVEEKEAKENEAKKNAGGTK